MPASAAQFRHVLGFFTVLGAVLTELPVWLDGTGATGVSALLRLIHKCLLLADVGSNCRTVRRAGAGITPRINRIWNQRPTLRLFGGSLRAGVHLALRAEDAAPFLVLSYGHPALNADSDSRPRLGIARKQLLQNGHECSEFVDFNLRRISGPEGLLILRYLCRPPRNFSEISLSPVALAKV